MFDVINYFLDRGDSYTLIASIASVAQARRTAGCLDFVVAADPLDPARVNVYERWDSETALAAFRGDRTWPGPDVGNLTCGRAETSRLVVGAAVSAPPFTACTNYDWRGALSPQANAQ